MASSNYFAECESPHVVHVELKKLLCCEYLHEEMCRENFLKFKLNCEKHFTTPAKKHLSNPGEIIEQLRSDGVISVKGNGDYGKLKPLVEDIDVDIVKLIEDAEERIKSFGRQTEYPSRKRKRKESQSYSRKVTKGHIMVTQITDFSILLKWEPMNTAEQYTIEYRIPSTEEIQTTVARSCEYRLTNLKHSTEYQVQIKVGTALVTEKIAFFTKGLTTEEIGKVYRDLNKSKVRLKNVRLMAIGHQGVGKTTLFHRLQNPHYIPSEDELKNIIPTSGIETELNYAVCTESGEMSLLGEEEICRRKLGLNAQEIGSCCY